MSWEKDIERLEHKICKANDRIYDVEGRVRTMETRQACSEINIKAHAAILEKIHLNTTWLLRLIIGFMVVAILGLLIQ